MPSYSWTLSGGTSYPTSSGSVDVSGLAAAVGLSTKYGIDITTWANEGQTEPDLDPNFTEIPETSKRCVTETVARALCQQRGSLDDAPNVGFDLRSMLNRPWTRQHLFNTQTSVEGEALKDERVFSASAALKWDQRAKSLTVKATIDTLTGSFPLVLSIDDVSIAILRSQ